MHGVPPVLPVDAELAEVGGRRGLRVLLQESRGDVLRLREESLVDCLVGFELEVWVRNLEAF